LSFAKHAGLRRETSPPTQTNHDFRNAVEGKVASLRLEKKRLSPILSNANRPVQVFMILPGGGHSCPPLLSYAAGQECPGSLGNPCRSGFYIDCEFLETALADPLQLENWQTGNPSTLYELRRASRELEETTVVVLLQLN